MNLSAEALRIAALKMLADDETGILNESKLVLQTELVELGVEKVAAKLPDGTQVASLCLGGGKSLAVVSDDDALLEWVARIHPDQTEAVIDPDAVMRWMQEHHPDEMDQIDTTLDVRPEYVDALLGSANATGEIADQDDNAVPGIEFMTSNYSLRLTFAGGKNVTPGRDAVREACRTGVINVQDLLGLLPSGHLVA
jgi:hypothetical protein